MVGHTELTLSIPTILIHMAMGAVGFLCLAKLVKKELFATPEGVSIERKVVISSLIVTLIGLIAALTHLGQPLSAWLMPFSHLSSSWLSREALFYLIFFVALVLYAILILGGKPQGMGITLIAAIAGLLAVLTGAFIYSGLGGVPSWSGIFTVLFFLLTYLVLGAAMFGICLVGLLKRAPSGMSQDMMKDVFRSTVMLLLPLIIIAIVVTGAYIMYLGGQGSPAADTANSMMGSGMFWIRVAVGLLVPLILVLVMKKALSKGELGSLVPYVFGAFLLLLTGEILGRILFYSTAVMYSMGGSGTPY